MNDKIAGIHTIPNNPIKTKNLAPSKDLYLIEHYRDNNSEQKHHSIKLKYLAFQEAESIFSYIGYQNDGDIYYACGFLKSPL